MRIIFQPANGERYAGSPQTEMRGDRRVIRFSYIGCTHYLLFQCPLDMSVKLDSGDVQEALLTMGDRVLDAREEALPGMEKVHVSCVTHTELYRNNGYIAIKDEAANYAVCGVFFQADQFQIMLPLPVFSYTTALSV